MNPILLLMVLLGYALGLLNAAWLVHRIATGLDLSGMGSGNLGARNLYDVTGKIAPAVLAGMLDVAKGSAAVLLAHALHPHWYEALVCAGIGVILGHNYNILLKWKGGRGLATALGVGVVCFPAFVVTWGTMYLVGYFIIRRNIHVACMTAIIATFFIAFSVPQLVIERITVFAVHDTTLVRLFVAGMCVLLFLRHIEPIRELLRQNADADDEDDD